MTTTKTSTVAARHRVKELVETPKSVVGGIEMLSLDRAATADLVIRLAKARGGGDEPITISSANGEVISRCATDARIADLHRDMAADAKPVPPVFVQRRNKVSSGGN